MEHTLSWSMLSGVPREKRSQENVETTQDELNPQGCLTEVNKK